MSESVSHFGLERAIGLWILIIFAGVLLVLTVVAALDKLDRVQQRRRPHCGIGGCPVCRGRRS